MPLRIAAKAAVAAQSRPSMLNTLVIVLVRTMPSMVSLTSSLETGRTSAMSMANSALSISSPRKKPAIEMIARIRGNRENSVYRAIAPATYGQFLWR